MTNAAMSGTPSMSIVIPTRDRASYLKYAIQTCSANPQSDLEILVLDNASTDETRAVVEQVSDPRVRYVRSDVRLSMRDNFEKGIELSTGRILLFIGDDDGVFPSAVANALELFARNDIQAVSAARAHYYWPDIVSGRRDLALLPRRAGHTVLEARPMLKHVLRDADYYRLPCVYHGFVRRDILERIRRRQGRLFLSSQVDMFSAIALSMEGVRYAFSEAPLVINGASKRSNGASHFGGGTETERNLWKKEDDLGFLPGFANSITVASLIIESVLRYCEANASYSLFDVLDADDVRAALATEVARRRDAGRAEEEIATLYRTAGVEADMPGRAPVVSGPRQRAKRMLRSFANARPINMSALGVTDVYSAAAQLTKMRLEGRTGFLDHPVEQVMAATRIARS
jgi:glycosyltransferase involved in cell wall biosynthesis